MIRPFLDLPPNTLTNSESYEKAVLDTVISRTPIRTSVVRGDPEGILSPPYFEIFSDALKIDGIRVNASVSLLLAIRDALNRVSPGAEPWNVLTPEISDYTYLQAPTKLRPVTLPISSTVESMIAHSRGVDLEIENAMTMLAGAGVILSSYLLADSGKDWVITPDGPATYGWHAPLSLLEYRKLPASPMRLPAELCEDYRVVQGPYLGHKLRHSDYSQTVRLWRKVNYC